MATVYAIVGLAGIASHVLFFHRFECHMIGVQLLLSFFTASAIIVGCLVKLSGLEILSAVQVTTLLDLSFLSGAYGSTLIYRMFLNPLNKFPGPWPARISSLYFSTKLGKSDACHKLLALHRKYGKYVRIGSNDLSVIDPDLVTVSFAPGSAVTKAPWYDMENPMSSMHTCRDKALHDRRRKVWAPAFSDKALREYESLIHRYNDKLVSRFRSSAGPINATLFFNIYSFDVMGSLAFGKEYHMLESGEKTHELDLLNEGMEPLAQMLPTWLMRMLMVIPGMLPGYAKFLAFCDQELTTRVNNDPRRSGSKEKPRVGSDILTWILEAYQNVKNPEKDWKLIADTRLIIVAGSDTTAATLTYLFYHLAQHPGIVQQIRNELQPLCQGYWTDKEIKHVDWLNGAINEALRLHPPVPSGLRRIVPKGGLMIGDTFVPGGTEFLMPQFVMARDSWIYERPDDFVPERWFDKPSMVKHKDAFHPFSLGPMGCIGKNLALIELRTLTAQILLEMDVGLAPGEDGKRLLFETKDHFTVALGDLDLVFKPIKA